MLNQYLSKVLSDEAVQSKGISLWQFPTPWDDVYALGTMLFSCRCLVSSHHDSDPDPELLRTLTILITCFTQPNSTLRLHLSSLEGINESQFNYDGIKEISEADQKKRP